MSHVMVCGLGEVGYRVALLLLDLGEDVTIVTLDSRQDWLDLVKGRGASVFVGDARDEHFLVRCGVHSMDCVMACIHNDSANIEIALDIQRICPEKRVIARIVDPGLARHAEKHLGVHRAVAMTASAAPTFAAATFGDSVLTGVKTGHDSYLALQCTGPRNLPSKPLVVVSPAGECVFHDSTEISEGESAVVLSHADAMMNLAPKSHHKRMLASALSPLSVAKFIHSVWTNTSVQLRAVIIAIVSLILISIAVFQVGMKLSIIDSIYFVVTTATTVGYGDITPKDAAGWMKLYACFMMLVSAAGMAVLFSVVTDYILTARMMQMRGHHHVPEQEHVIVVGVGVVGYRTIKELDRLKAPSVAIEMTENCEHLAQVRAHTHVIIGDGREPETLHRAGIDHARAIVALTPSDATNLSIGLTAKELNPDVRVVLSILDADFADKISGISEIDAALSAPVLAAPSFVGAALYPGSIASFRLGSKLFTLVRDEHGVVELGGHRLSLEVREISAPG